jgi:hypothetical protein
MCAWLCAGFHAAQKVKLVTDVVYWDFGHRDDLRACAPLVAACAAVVYVYDGAKWAAVRRSAPA